MSFGPFSPHNKYAPGLDEKTNGRIESILLQWKRAGIGQIRERRGKK